MKRSGVEDLVWDYVELSLAPFVNGLFEKYNKVNGGRQSIQHNEIMTIEQLVQKLEVKIKELTAREVRMLLITMILFDDKTHLCEQR
jgi:hypothetical protein